jgi:hypothetical protein
MLLHRRASSRLTCVYVENMDALGEQYGQLFRQHLLANYIRTVS